MILTPERVNDFNETVYSESLYLFQLLDIVNCYDFCAVVSNTGTRKKKLLEKKLLEKNCSYNNKATKHFSFTGKSYV